MENSDQRLVNLMTDINLIYLEAKEKKTDLQKKLEHYTNGITLISEAEQLLDLLQNQIAGLDMTKADKSQVGNAKSLIETLSIPNLNYKELINIVQQLKQISAGLPNTPKITDNMEKDALYEEQEVDVNL